MAENTVLVIGGGAAGMMAAGQAAAGGARVFLIEKNDRLGRKLAISGKGRCNITNDKPISDFCACYPGNGRFLQGILHEFDNVRLRSFLAGYGVETKVERGGRVFPVAGEAESVVRALSKFLAAAGVEVKLGQAAEAVIAVGGKVRGVRVAGGRTYPGKAVIVCTGGATYPATGSSGDGYRFAQDLGHRVISPRPALVSLRTAEGWVSELQGLSLRNVAVTLKVDGRAQASDLGEMLFTHFGVSGPLVLTLSRLAGDALRQGKRVKLEVNLKPGLNPEQLDRRLQRDFSQAANKQFKNALNALLPQSLIPVIIRLAGIDPDKVVHQVTRNERRSLAALLQSLPLTVSGTLPLAAAIVTAGGVDVKTIDPKTMASKSVQGLYWAGEVVDVDGVTGGYNLQAAFAMGYRAGRAAGRYAQGSV
ncbi:Pyridine nucleotide disulphide reductase class-I [Acididesulfobacillus acetoxydans]|uniref:HI0933 protein n=1 Tax=Acididesulfobacillus acetoxydans TaxID=1561005 RepID=A0A8S0X5Y6_9FIRM|nr:NAD(P)/FAD-dependent oxidoreductase [Acididesulfobacillus acetoxydans]CAA7602050.1 Pyridine nucleotide disulphide reductase class-I [Acididesulfobacillus acetoxydans]CEJ08107.1 HI0933 protein [Acididesulfobacillus acetoxydans]